MTDRNPIDDYEAERRERLNSLAPQRSQFERPNVYGSQKDDADTKRIREHRAQQYREFVYRTTGKPATEAAVREFLGEGGQQ